MTNFNTNPITYFAETNYRKNRDRFGIFLNDRLHHFYILGRTGTGKTILLKTKIKQDIQKRGVCLIDVHGDLVLKVLRDIPKNRQHDVVSLDAMNPNLQLGYNPLRKVSYEKRALVASNILEVLQKLWGTQGFGVKMAHILRNV